MALINHRVSPDIFPSDETERDREDSWHDGENSKDLDKISEELIMNPCFREGTQERLDCPTEDHQLDVTYDHNEKTDRNPFNGQPKKNAWNSGEGESMKRNHACDRLVLLALCFMSVVSLLLTMLMLFGKVGPTKCDCSGKPDGQAAASQAELLKRVQDLNENVTSLRVQLVPGSVTDTVEKSVTESVSEMSKNLTGLKEVTEKNRKNISTELEEMKLKYGKLQEKIKLMEDRISSIELNGSASSSGEREGSDLDLTPLWLAVNSTTKMLSGLPTIWTAVNASSKGLYDVRMQVVELDQKVKNSSKSISPRGPPGYNGTQGSAGSPGSQGLPGPPGIGSNITLCTYKTDTSPGKTAGRYARNEISVTETKGKKFLGVNCDTNDARVCLLSSTVGSDKLRAYKCSCENTLGTGAGNMHCYVHYWECQTNT